MTPWSEWQQSEPFWIFCQNWRKGIVEDAVLANMRYACSAVPDTLKHGENFEKKPALLLISEARDGTLLLTIRLPVDSMLAPM